MNKLIVIVLIVILYIFISKFGKFGKSAFKNNGFANIDAKYIMPIVFNNLITPTEADYIIETSKKSFKESKIISGLDSNIRKSKTTWLYKDDPIIYNIIKRICDMNGFPIVNAEPLQVVQYEPGGYYNDHHDSCCDDDPKCTDFVQNGGQRILTVLIYLNDDFTGGATKFSTIGKEIKAPKYGGIVFRPVENDSNKCHPLALHKGMPVNSGIKYVCNIWIRESEYS